MPDDKQKDKPAKPTPQGMLKAQRVAMAAATGAFKGVLHGKPTAAAQNAAAGAGIGAARELAEISDAKHEIKDSINIIEIIYDTAVNGADIKDEDLKQYLSGLTGAIEVFQRNNLPLPKKLQPALLSLEKVTKSAAIGAVVGVLNGGIAAPPAELAANAATGAGFAAAKEIAELTHIRHELVVAVEAAEAIYEIAAQGKPVTSEKLKIFKTNLQNIYNGVAIMRQYAWPLPNAIHKFLVKDVPGLPPVAHQELEQLRIKLKEYLMSDQIMKAQHAAKSSIRIINFIEEFTANKTRTAAEKSSIDLHAANIHKALVILKDNHTPISGIVAILPHNVKSIISGKFGRNFTF